MNIVEISVRIITDSEEENFSVTTSNGRFRLLDVFGLHLHSMTLSMALRYHFEVDVLIG